MSRLVTVYDDWVCSRRCSKCEDDVIDSGDGPYTVHVGGDEAPNYEGVNTFCSEECAENWVDDDMLSQFKSYGIQKVSDEDMEIHD